jgi:glutamate/tyrosine decarboxylase-like PLP-dependent enzyme
MKAVRTEIRELMEQTTETAARYLETLEARRVFPTVEALGRLQELGGPLPADGAEPAEVLRLLDEIGSPATVATAGPRYFGFVTGGALPATLAANWLAGAWDQCAGLDVLSPVSSALEEISAQWLLELFGLPSKCGVGFVTGATMANFTALAAARNAVLERAGWDVEADGLIGAPKITVIGGEEIHISAVKALACLGSDETELCAWRLTRRDGCVRNCCPELTGPRLSAYKQAT